MQVAMTDSFFAYAIERHKIYLRRLAGEAQPWTRDPILQNYRFTNIYRELDKTTAWFKQNVRDKYNGSPDVMLATVIFRWFNRIESGEAIFCQQRFPNGTAFEDFLNNGDSRVLREALKAYCGDGPYFTGAYMIRSPTGLTKLEGMCEMVKRFNSTKHLFNGKAYDWREVAWLLKHTDYPLELVWDWLKRYNCQGPFHAYECVTDLRHTFLLERAPDIMTWANPGPGAVRGASRMLQLGFRVTPTGKTRPKRIETAVVRDVMAKVLDVSKERWPKEWPVWEMREVEHTLCEWDKYMRTKLGQGTPRGRFK